MTSCRSLDRVVRLLGERLVDGIVVSLRDAPLDGVLRLRAAFPGIPIFAFSGLRPDDGLEILACEDAGVHVLVFGVDEPIVGEYVSARSAAAHRRAELGEAPEMLRLEEPIQRRAWNEILSRVDTAVRTSTVADALGLSREHLSREFAAGDAPNLKRVIDLARLACAAQMLANPGYSVERVASVLGYASASHLAGSAARIAGVRPSALAGLGPRGVLHRFRAGRTRSRL